MKILNVGQFSFLLTYEDKRAHSGKEYELCWDVHWNKETSLFSLGRTEDLLGGNILGSLLNSL